MSLSSGMRLGSYEILTLIGAGGMGEVYRAKDTKLGREVALKILPATFTSDPDRLARFRREAQVLAALNHPHIGAIYGLDEANGTQFLVLELVDGESLDKRIARGKIPVDEALGIARQIAEALEAAHEKGIIHRDLKPANIALTHDGTVKVLDFGLAKVAEPASGTSLDVTNSPTITTPAMMTGIGVILGTAAYMSPEQAKGRLADKRSDIWAFGCVLYEMLAGQRAFDGEDVSDTIANVLKSQPTWSALPLEVGPPIRALIEACLRKDRVARVGDLATAKFVINELTPLWRTPVAHVTTQQRWTMVGAVIAIVTVILAVGLILMNQVAHRPAGLGIVTRFALSLGAGDRLPALDQSHRVVDISPDGTRIVFAANRQLYLRRLDELDATPIRGTALGESSNLESDPVDPFFSTDGQWVGFWQAGQLKKVSAAGGTPTVICIVPRPTAGASWGADDAILFGLGPEGIWRVSSAGGTPQPLVPVSSGQGALNPQLIAANQVLYTERTVRGATPRADQIVVYSITDGTRHVIVDNGSAGRYLTTGHLVYVTDGVIQGIRFDVPRLTSSGGAVPLVEGIAQSNVFAAAHYAVSHTGTLVFAPEQAGGRMLVWVDRHGREEPIAAPVRGYADPRLSPDGTRIAVAISRPEKDRGVWIWDSSRTNLVRLTADKRGSHPIWSRDGRYVVFSSGEGIQRLAADGSGTLEHLFASTLVTFPDTLTSDSRELLVEQRNQAAMRQQWDVSVVSTQVDGRIFPLLTGPSNERSAEFSPDGRWIAYVSDESGSDEVYVRRYPNVNDGRWSVSVDGGRDPVWARNGRELFYVAPRGRIMAVTVRTEPAFSAERPIQLLSGYEPTGLGRYFDVAPDGDRFLLLKEKKSSDTSRLIVVENWFEELKSRVPTK